VIPDYLTANPFPDSEWSPAEKPLVVLDGATHSIQNLDRRIAGDTAYFVGVNQREFERAMDLVSARVIQFYEMRVPDTSALETHDEIVELAIQWNTKIADISSICRMSSLKSLVLVDTPKIIDLSPLASCDSLEVLEFSGGVWNKNRAESLEPIGMLPSLKSLRLLNIAVNSCGLRPLSKAKRLSELELSNQFPTGDYAYLSARLPHVNCEHFQPYVRLSSDIDGNDTMIVGRRKPLLNMKRDSARLENYVKEFAMLQRKYANSHNDP